ncbi:MAG: hypothetical protein R3E53_13600 [Myxococcota bacterium]
MAYDFGVKRNILRLLVEQGFDVTVVPATTPAAETLALEPDGIFLSNGPGDPAAIEGVQPIVRELVTKKPSSGSASVADPGPRPRRHDPQAQVRSSRRQPAGQRTSRPGKVAICAENHGYAVEAESLTAAGEPVEITHVNLNDQTVEGLAHAKRPLFSVQYHPEASPGPHDAAYFFSASARWWSAPRTVNRSRGRRSVLPAAPRSNACPEETTSRRSW